MSCQLGRETRGTVLEAASEVGLALSSAASVWSSVGAAREHRIFLLCESMPDRLKVAAPDDSSDEEWNGDDDEDEEEDGRVYLDASKCGRVRLHAVRVPTGPKRK